MRIILASSSPRRQELMTRVIKEFEVIVADVDERETSGMSPLDYVSAMAQKKAEAVHKKYPTAIVIGCDTIVVKNETILGKPENSNEALQMLRLLSDGWHTVYTSVFIFGNDQVVQETIPTKVFFYKLEEEEIREYLLTEEYKDKAGSYGIQGQGALFVKEIIGNYYSIVGFPIASVSRMLKKIMA